MEAFVGRFVALTCWCTSHVLCFVCHANDAVLWTPPGIYVRKLMLHHDGALRLVGGFIVTRHLVVVVVVVCHVVFDATHQI